MSRVFLRRHGVTPVTSLTYRDVYCRRRGRVLAQGAGMVPRSGLLVHLQDALGLIKAGGSRCCCRRVCTTAAARWAAWPHPRQLLGRRMLTTLSSPGDPAAPTAPSGWADVHTPWSFGCAGRVHGQLAPADSCASVAACCSNLNVGRCHQVALVGSV